MVHAKADEISDKPTATAETQSQDRSVFIGSIPYCGVVLQNFVNRPCIPYFQAIGVDTMSMRERYVAQCVSEYEWPYGMLAILWVLSLNLCLISE